MAAGLRHGVEIRSAALADTAEIARLLASRDASGAMVARLEAVRAHPAAAILVASGYGGLSGVVALTWAPVLQEARPVAQVTLLRVDAEERRRGIGRMLLKAASHAARAAGCERMLWPIGADEAEVAAFCRATGFQPQGAVFVRSLRRRADAAPPG